MAGSESAPSFYPEVRSASASNPDRSDGSHFGISGWQPQRGGSYARFTPTGSLKLNSRSSERSVSGRMKKPASPGAAAPPPPTPLHHFFCAAVVRVPDRFTSRSAVPGWARSGRRERESRGGSGRAHLADRWSARSFARMPLPRPPPPPRRSFLPLFPFLHRIYCIVERTERRRQRRRHSAEAKPSLASASLSLSTDGDRSGCLGCRGGSERVLAPSAVTCETAQREHL